MPFRLACKNAEMAQNPYQSTKSCRMYACRNARKMRKPMQFFCLCFCAACGIMRYLLLQQYYPAQPLHAAWGFLFSRKTPGPGPCVRPRFFAPSGRVRHAGRACPHRVRQALPGPAKRAFQPFSTAQRHKKGAALSGGPWRASVR